VHDALAGAQIPTHTYAHANADAARRTLERVGSERPAIFTDAVFPARGHCAPLAELLELLPERGVLVVDDCHGFGVLGAHGRGTLEELLLHDPRLVLTGTLSKAFGCFGGFIAGSRALIDQARTRSRAYVGSTPIPPALAHAGSAALAQLALEPERLARLRDNIELLRATFRKLGLETHALRHPVFALKRATPEDMDVAYRTFLSEGLLVPYIQYPDGLGGYLRISLCADHSADDVTRLGATLQKVLA
jgi:8-amino-7-oxononanoate synthase